MRLFITLMSLSIVLWSCSDKKETSQDNSENTEEVSSAQDSTVFLGEEFEIGQVVSVASLAQKAEGQDSLQIIARGKVTEVCQAKGCWMTLEMPNQGSMRVTFKDYGFFMPKDLAGKEVIMNGVAKQTTTDVATLKHLAEDAGKSKEEIEQITEPEVALAFVAEGVTIVE